MAGYLAFQLKSYILKIVSLISVGKRRSGGTVVETVLLLVSLALWACLEVGWMDCSSATLRPE
jgi:hypothetical protein